MAAWLRGAGEAAPSAGLALVAAPTEEERRRQPSAAPAAPEAATQPTVGGPRTWSDDDWSFEEADFRTLYYGRGGDAATCVVGADAPAWLAKLTADPSRDSIEAARGSGRILVHLSESDLDACFHTIERAAKAGQQFLVLAPDGGEAAAKRGRRLRAAGFRSLRVWPPGAAVRTGRGGEGRGTLVEGARAWAAGRRAAPLPTLTLDYEEARLSMDPIDGGREKKEDSVKKLERAWTPIAHDAEKWRGKGLKPSVERLMTVGAEVEGPDVPGLYEIPQYKFADWEHEQKGGLSPML